MMATQVKPGYHYGTVNQLGKVYVSGIRTPISSTSFVRDVPTNGSNVSFTHVSPASKYGGYSSSTLLIALIDENGELWSSGTPNGRNDTTYFAKFDPSLVDGKKFIDVQAINNAGLSASNTGAIALAEDGTFYYWGNLGRNIDPADGDNQKSESQIIKKISIDPIPGAKKLYYKTTDAYNNPVANAVYVIDNAGNVWSWGYSSSIGRESADGSHRIPGLVDFNGKKIEKIALSNDSLALDEDGNVWSWNWQYKPSIIVENNPNDKIVDVAATSGSSSRDNGCILVYESGKVEGWWFGSGSSLYFYPELDGVTQNNPAKRVELPMPEPIQSAEINSQNGNKYWAYFVGKSGKVYSLGYNSQSTTTSRLGNGVDGTVNNPVPTEVVGLPLENLFTITAKNEEGEDIPGVGTQIIRVETWEVRDAQIGQNYVLGHGTFEVGTYNIPEEYYWEDSKYFAVNTQGKEYRADFVFKRRDASFEGTITATSNVDNTVFIGNKDIVFENGVAEIDAPGTYEITAIAEGYNTQMKSVVITKEEPNASVNFELERIPEPEPEPDQEDDYWLSNQPYFNKENLNIGEAK